LCPATANATAVAAIGNTINATPRLLGCELSVW
jgi:hypothetical protein